MKLYLLFGGDNYYPGGGAQDFESAHEDKDRAIRAGRQFLAGTRLKWAHVFDCDRELIVWARESGNESQI